MRFGVLINAHAAQGRNGAVFDHVQRLFAANGLHARAKLVGNTEVVETARSLLRGHCDALAAGGGDGTLSTVADLCAREGVPLGVLPLGTHNHFARDAGLPLQLDESIRCLAEGSTRRVDLGMVNGSYFINNSSIGAYPRAVEERDRLRQRLAFRKHIAALVATLRIFARHPEIHARLEIDGRAIERSGPFIFVGNNEYTVRFFAPQLRRSLDAGRLCVYTARCNGVPGLLRLLWLTLIGRLDQDRDFETNFGREVTVRLPRDSVRVAKDGEVMRMRAPLRYQIAPLALQIFSPA